MLNDFLNFTVSNVKTYYFDSEEPYCELQLFKSNIEVPIYQLPRIADNIIKAERITQYRIVSNGLSECCWAVLQRRQ